jgi:O-antigen/teichoic acid export membrane protein
VFQVAVSDLVRRGDFRFLGAIRLSQGALFAVLPMIPGINLVWGLVLSFVPGAVRSAGVLRGQPWGRVREAAWKFRRFPLYSLPGAMLDVAGTSAVIWIVTGAYGMGTAGQYSQVARLLGGPLFLVGAALFQVLLRTSSEHVRAGRGLQPLVSSTAWRLLGMAFLVVLLTALFGERLLGLLLGPGWRVDTLFLVLIVSAAAIRAAVSPLSSVLVATGRLGPLTAWQATYCVTSLVALPWLAGRAKFETFLWIFVGHEALLYGTYFLLIHWASRTTRQ